MNPENTKKLKKRIAVGVWLDMNDQPHISIPELIKHFEVEDTPENHERMKQIALEAIRKQNPDAIILYGATPDAKREKL